jgi:hypothetical protein
VLPALSGSGGEPAAPSLEAAKPDGAPAPAAVETKGRPLRAIPIPQSQPGTEAQGPLLESPPAASSAAPAEPPASLPAGPPLPLWLDFLVPVAVGALILLVFWLLVLQLLVDR